MSLPPFVRPLVSLAACGALAACVSTGGSRTNYAAVDCPSLGIDPSPLVPDGAVDTTPRPLITNPKPPFPAPGEFRATAPGSVTLQAGAGVAGAEQVVRGGGDVPTAGSVTVAYVVDTRGCPEPSSLRVVSATDSAFAQSVRQVLPRFRHEPARLNGQPVRTWLQWEFKFFQGSGAGTPM